MFVQYPDPEPSSPKIDVHLKALVMCVSRNAVASICKVFSFHLAAKGFVQGKFFTVANVLHGWPQGSILGPFLHPVMIKDLVENGLFKNFNVCQ